TPSASQPRASCRRRSLLLVARSTVELGQPRRRASNLRLVHRSRGRTNNRFPRARGPQNLSWHLRDTTKRSTWKLSQLPICALCRFRCDSEVAVWSQNARVGSKGCPRRVALIPATGNHKASEGREKRS